METVIILVFVFGYLAITLEHNIKIDKLNSCFSYDGYKLGLNFIRDRLLFHNGLILQIMD